MEEAHNAADGGLTFPPYADREAGERLVEETILGDEEPAEADAPSGRAEHTNDPRGGSQHQATS